MHSLLLLILPVVALLSTGTAVHADTFLYHYDATCLTDVFTQTQNSSDSWSDVIIFTYNCPTNQNKLITIQEETHPHKFIIKLGENLYYSDGYHRPIIQEVPETVEPEEIQLPQRFLDKVAEQKLKEEQIQFIKQCYGGYGQAALFQAPYAMDWDEFLDYYTTHLDKRHLIDQNCIAQEYVNATALAMYPGKIHDDPEPRQLEERVIDATIATTEDIKISEAKRVLEFACDPQNAHLGLCRAYQEFTGDNRGNPEPIVDTKLYNEWLEGQAARDLTPRDYERTIEASKQIMCDVYMPQYSREGIIPHWLTHCNT